MSSLTLDDLLRGPLALEPRWMAVYLGDPSFKDIFKHVLNIINPTSKTALICLCEVHVHSEEERRITKGRNIKI